MPVWKIKADRVEFEQLKFKFEVEKEYMKREVCIYREMIKSLTASHNFNENYNGGGQGYGASWTKNMTTDKPFLPTETNFDKDKK